MDAAGAAANRSFRGHVAVNKSRATLHTPRGEWPAGQKAIRYCPPIDSWRYTAGVQIDLAAIKARILSGLPKQARWIINGVTLDFDFSPERFSLRYVNDRDIVGGPVPDEWEGCRIFGMQDYDEGGGASPWISIRERDGFVCGLDIERTGSTIFIFNSCLDRFIRAFQLIDPYLRAGAALPPDLRSQIRAVDPEVFERSDWRETIDFVNGH